MGSLGVQSPRATQSVVAGVAVTCVLVRKADFQTPAPPRPQVCIFMGCTGVSGAHGSGGSEAGALPSLPAAGHPRGHPRPYRGLPYVSQAPLNLCYIKEKIKGWLSGGWGGGERL